MAGKASMSPINWKQLIGQLERAIQTLSSKSSRQASSGPEPSPSPREQRQVLALLERYESNQRDFSQHVQFHPSGYTKNLVTTFENNLANVIVMCWAPAQASAFHAHEGSRCFVKVLQGRLTEERLAHPNLCTGALVELVAPLLRTHALETNEVAYIDDSLGCHRVTNASLLEPAVTLHVYVPPYERCRVFDLDQRDGENARISMDKSRVVQVFQ